MLLCKLRSVLTSALTKTIGEIQTEDKAARGRVEARGGLRRGEESTEVDEKKIGDTIRGEGGDESCAKLNLNYCGYGIIACSHL